MEIGPQPRRPQLQLKTVVSVCLIVLLVAAIVAMLLRALLVLALTALSMLIAVALDHPARALQRRRVPRGIAIAIVLGSVLAVLVAIVAMLVPPAVEQGSQLVERAPQLLRSVEGSSLFHTLDAHLGLSQWLHGTQDGARIPSIVGGAAMPLLSVLGGTLNLVVAVITVSFLTTFMLIFGEPLVYAALDEARPERRELYRSMLAEIYGSLGGYIGGLLAICTINATLTTLFLAISGVPYFLPLGILSGFSSLVPYAGPVVAGALISLLGTLQGLWHGVACAIYFVVYGQLEGNVLGPLVFRRAVHMNPLITLWSVLFFGELGGVLGAVAAVPAAATCQIIVRELLRIRREARG
ncbi:MAG TPA: AI-2E family transporter [Polyangiales bacterium]|nr:AI-2E family transporter [Polyangiales bacterium]